MCLTAIQVLILNGIAAYALLLIANGGGPSYQLILLYILLPFFLYFFSFIVADVEVNLFKKARPDIAYGYMYGGLPVGTIVSLLAFAVAREAGVIQGLDFSVSFGYTPVTFSSFQSLLTILVLLPSSIFAALSSFFYAYEKRRPIQAREYSIYLLVALLGFCQMLAVVFVPSRLEMEAADVWHTFGSIFGILNISCFVGGILVALQLLERKGLAVAGIFFVAFLALSGAYYYLERPYSQILVVLRGIVLVLFPVAKRYSRARL
jgi:hypothetical protein